MKKASHIYRRALRKQRPLAGRRRGARSERDDSPSAKPRSLSGASGPLRRERGFRSALFTIARRNIPVSVPLFAGKRRNSRDKRAEMRRAAFPSRRGRTKQRLFLAGAKQGVHNEQADSRIYRDFRAGVLWLRGGGRRRDGVGRPTAVNLSGIASAFGFAIVAMAYGIGPISGCHVNPAVSFGVYVAGRMSVADMISYWIAQVLGAIVGAVVLYIILSGKAQGLDRRTWPERLGRGLPRRIQYGLRVRVRSGGDVPVPGLHSRRHAPDRAHRLRRSRHRPDAGRDPSGRHQHHRHLGQSGALDRSGAGRDRLESAAQSRSSGSSSSRP